MSIVILILSCSFYILRCDRESSRYNKKNENNCCLMWINLFLNVWNSSYLVQTHFIDQKVFFDDEHLLLQHSKNHMNLMKKENASYFLHHDHVRRQRARWIAFSKSTFVNSEFFRHLHADFEISQFFWSFSNISTLLSSFAWCSFIFLQRSTQLQRQRDHWIHLSHSFRDFLHFRSRRIYFCTNLICFFWVDVRLLVLFINLWIFQEVEWRRFFFESSRNRRETFLVLNSLKDYEKRRFFFEIVVSKKLKLESRKNKRRTNIATKTSSNRMIIFCVRRKIVIATWNFIASIMTMFSSSCRNRKRRISIFIDINSRFFNKSCSFRKFRSRSSVTLKWSDSLIKSRVRQNREESSSFVDVINMNVSTNVDR